MSQPKLKLQSPAQKKMQKKKLLEKQKIIKEVWASNFEEEFGKIMDLAETYTVISLVRLIFIIFYFYKFFL